MKVIVSSNCMTGGLVAALSLLQPENQFVPIPLSLNDSDILSSALSEADCWLVSVNDDGAINPPVSNPGLRVIRFPELYFDAFHPDQVYAWLPDGALVESVSGPYHSAIALWAWQHGLSSDETKRMFVGEVFDGLGYHDRWTGSVNRLAQLFKNFEGFTHNDFLFPLIRGGAFMHTVNHPKLSAICSLARLLATAIFPADRHYDQPIEDVLLDSLFLASFSWPVYPSVANSLGLKGSFLWKLEDHSVIGLDEFIDSSFARYAEQDLSEIDCHQLRWPMYDLVLPNVVSRV